MKVLITILLTTLISLSNVVANVKQWKEAIGALVMDLPDEQNAKFKDDLTYLGNGSYRLNTWSLEERYSVSKTKLCPNVSEGKLPMASKCTVFLIAPNQIATAGHCLYAGLNIDEDRAQYPITQNIDLNERFSHLKILFNSFSSKTHNPIIDEENIYSVKTLIKGRNTSLYDDYIVLELDRDVQDITPLELDTTSTLNSSDTLITIGHPLGNPLKVSEEFSNFLDFDYFFYTDAKIRSGASGSPVFNLKTNKVVGLISAKVSDDFIISESKNCYELSESKAWPQGGTTVQKISRIYSEENLNQNLNEAIFIGNKNGELLENVITLLKSGASLESLDSFGLELFQIALKRYEYFGELDSIDFLLKMGLTPSENDLLTAQKLRNKGREEAYRILANK